MFGHPGPNDPCQPPEGTLHSQTSRVHPAVRLDVVLGGVQGPRKRVARYPYAGILLLP